MREDLIPHGVLNRQLNFAPRAAFLYRCNPESPGYIRTTNNRLANFSSLEFNKTKVEIDNGSIGPHFAPIPGAAAVLSLLRRAEGVIHIAGLDADQALLPETSSLPFANS